MSDAYGNTPAHKMQDSHKLKTLIEHGADIFKKNHAGKPPCEIPKYKDIVHAAHNISKHGAECHTNLENLDETRMALGQNPEAAWNILQKNSTHLNDLDPKSYTLLMRLAVRRYTNSTTSKQHAKKLKDFIDNMHKKYDSGEDTSYRNQFMHDVWYDMQHALKSPHVFGYMLRRYRTTFATYRDENGNKIAHIIAKCPNLSRYLPSSIMLLTRDDDDRPVTNIDLRNEKDETPHRTAEREYNHTFMNVAKQMDTIRHIFAYNRIKRGILYNTYHHGVPQHAINRIFAYLEVPYKH